MKIKEIMTKDVRTTTPQVSLKECLGILMQQRLNGLVVTDGEKVAGLVTKADIFRAILPTQSEIADDELYMKDLEYTEERIFKCLDKRVDEIMGKPAVTLDCNLPIIKAGTMMVLNKIKQVPIVDSGKLVGIITLSDILGVLLKKTNGWQGEFLR
jgi:CBS domain-containing protein